MALNNNSINSNVSMPDFLKSSVNNNREFLKKHGVLPTNKEAESSFWSLGNDWWKQMIDGKFHEYGQMVFDQGLHKGPIEPGYIKGIKNASQHFIKNFDRELNIDLYKEIHHVACEHFNINQDNGIQCDKNLIDTYRTVSEGSKFEIDEPEFNVLTQNFTQTEDLWYDLRASRGFLNGLVRLISEGNLEEFNNRIKENSERITEIKALFKEHYNVSFDEMNPQEIKTAIESTEGKFQNICKEKGELKKSIDEKNL
ncbi:MAG: hypothetical protein H0T62_04215 [Parachlamydiaceae bacterium]|nr:hypothetical protein [Parachlamydiaceae bacterium]